MKMKESEKKDEYVDIARELKKDKQQGNMKVTVIHTICNWCIWNNPQRLVKVQEYWKYDEK